MDEHDKHFDLFFRSMDAEDDLGFVIRAQVFIDAALRDIIQARLHKPEELGDWSVRLFPKRVKLASALGWCPDAALLDALNKLYEYRNRLAHKLGSILTESEANDLYGRFPDDERARVDLQVAQADKTWNTKMRFSISSLVGRMLKEAQS